jgi:Family of unknown function (DUF6232)
LEVAVTVYYRGPNARITADFFESSGLTTGRVSIGDIGRVMIAGPKRVGSESLRSQTAVGCGSAAFITIGSLLARLDAAERLSILVLSLATIASLVVFGDRRRRSMRMWEIWATLGGGLACIFRSTDETEFGQVCRALRRALEARDGC